MIDRPLPDEFAPFYHRYVDAVKGEDLFTILSAQPDDYAGLLADADPDYAYAEGKWTVRELVQHVIDTERVFAFRALWWARGSEEPLAGFDQDVWVRHDPGQSLSGALSEMRAVRASTIAMLRPLAPEAWTRSGIASGSPMSVRAAAWVTAGHTAHHAAILRDRYTG